MLLKRQARIAVRLAVLFLLALVSSCTCLHSAEVVNDTDSPLFANISNDWKGQRWEEEGILIPPHSRAELSWAYSDFLRVRDMSGNTVAFQELPESGDTRLVVSSLEPLSVPEPLGVPEGSGSEGVSEWRAVICRDGHEEKIPMFRMTVTILSNFNGPLIVSGIEPSSDRDMGGEIRGMFVPPKGETSLSLHIVEQAWIRAFDPQSRLVFTSAVPREPHPIVTIPSSLPPEPESIPTLDFSRRTGLGTDCSPMPNLTLGTVAVVVLLLLALAAPGLAVAILWFLLAMA